MHGGRQKSTQRHVDWVFDSVMGMKMGVKKNFVI
jgi:hypothetical protein